MDVRDFAAGNSVEITPRMLGYPGICLPIKTECSSNYPNHVSMEVHVPLLTAYIYNNMLLLIPQAGPISHFPSFHLPSPPGIQVHSLSDIPDGEYFFQAQLLQYDEYHRENETVILPVTCVNPGTPLVVGVPDGCHAF